MAENSCCDVLYNSLALRNFVIEPLLFNLDAGDSDADDDFISKSNVQARVGDDIEGAAGGKWSA